MRGKILPVLCCIFAAHSTVAIEIDKRIDHENYGDGTFFHFVVVKVGEKVHFAWNPGNNIGPHGQRVSWYTWPTYRDGREIPENLTTPGNGGHAQLIGHLDGVLRQDPSIDLIRKIEQEEMSIISDLSFNTQDLAALFLNRDLMREIVMGWRSIAFQTLSLSERKAADVLARLFEMRQSRSDLTQTGNLGPILILGGGVQILRSQGETSAFIRLTSRSADWAVSFPSYYYFRGLGSPDFWFQSSDPYVTAVAKVKEPYTFSVPSQNTAMVSPTSRGLVKPEYRSLFVRTLDRAVPDLRIKLIPHAFKDLTEEQRQELEATIGEHNSHAHEAICNSALESSPQ